MREHEFHAIGARRVCRHCGTSEKECGPERTCIDRPGQISAVMPEPKRRVPACEETDTIAARLAELAAERQAAFNHDPDAPAANAEVKLAPDGCCYC